MSFQIPAKFCESESRLNDAVPDPAKLSGTGWTFRIRPSDALSGSGQMIEIRVRPIDDDPDPAKCCGSLSGKLMMIQTRPNVADLNPQNLIQSNRGWSHSSINEIPWEEITCLLQPPTHTPSPSSSACTWLTNLPVHSLPLSFTW